MAHYKQSFRLMTYEQVNNRAFLESLAKRQRELTESNAKILDWAMKIVSVIHPKNQVFLSVSKPASNVQGDALWFPPHSHKGSIC